MKLLICLTFVVVMWLSVMESVVTEEVHSQGKSPYVELILCPARTNPWECAREQTSRLLDEWSDGLKFQWQDLKGAADKELNATLARRGFSSMEGFKEKPSTILRKLEIGTKFVEKFIEEVKDDLLGRSDDNQNESDYDEDEDEIAEDADLLDQSNNELKKKPLNEFPVKYPHQSLNAVNGLIDDGKRKKFGLKNPINYGRSNGVTRSRRRKKKKALVKLMLLATILKGKIELLLKILSAHLQIKFFAIALVGLVINIARFWVDLKRGHSPQKVIYYEHAHHQHHYEDQPSDDWGEQAGSISSGGYWKRSLPTGSDASSTLIANNQNPNQNKPTYGGIDLTYSATQQDPQYIAYRRQIPMY